MAFDPEIWLESATRELKAYIETGFNNAIVDETSQPVGLQLYEVMMEFPGPRVDDVKAMPLDRSIIHFEIDDIADRLVGFGDQVFAENYDPVGHQNFPQEAGIHVINFDVGVWASDRSGGTTSRLRAKQVLRNLLQGKQAQAALTAATDGGDGGLQIKSFTGGRFVPERVNDVPIYRMVDSTLEIQVFSRTPLPITGGPTIEDFVQQPGLTILD